MVELKAGDGEWECGYVFETGTAAHIEEREIFKRGEGRECLQAAAEVERERIEPL